MPHGFGINAASDLRQDFAHQQRRHAAGELHDLDAALRAGPRLGERLAMLARYQVGDLVEVAHQQFAEAEHEPRPLDNRCFRPGGQGFRGRFHRGIHFACRGERRFGDSLAGRWIENIAGTGGCTLRPVAGNQQRNGFDGHGGILALYSGLRDHKNRTSDILFAGSLHLVDVPGTLPF
jgi:hypothetical protein